jgi:hypothetical protein
MTTPRPVDVARLGLGLAAATRPDLLLRLSRARDGRGERVTVRILGARYVVQSGAGLILSRSRWRPGGRPWVRDADTAVDLIHAGTMIALATVAPQHRQLALLSAGAAIGFAATDLREKLR